MYINNVGVELQRSAFFVALLLSFFCGPEVQIIITMSMDLAHLRLFLTGVSKPGRVDWRV